MASSATLCDDVEAAIRARLRQRGGWTEPDIADAVLAAVAERIKAEPVATRGEPTKRRILALLSQPGEDA